MNVLQLSLTQPCYRDLEPPNILFQLTSLSRLLNPESSNTVYYLVITFQSWVMASIAAAATEVAPLKQQVSGPRFLH